MLAGEKMEVFVRCANCGITKSLPDAVIDEWRLCRICGMIFCDNCVIKKSNNSLCNGSKYTKPHPPEFQLLPVDELLDFAKDIQRHPREGKFISKIFYEKKTKLLVGKRKKPSISKEEALIIRYRQEQWKKFGTVLVKRKDGKFITWGQIE